MRMISCLEHVSGEEYKELQRLYFLQMHKVADLQRSNTDLHNLLTECRLK